MGNFVFTELVNDPPATVVSAALGPDTSTNFATIDKNKAVKLAAANNYVLCTDGDEIEGFVTSVEVSTVNDGFTFGGVQTDRRMTVECGTTTTIAHGTLVVAASQEALGTNTNGYALVKTGAPTSFLWRLIRNITDPGNSAETGDIILIERV